MDPIMTYELSKHYQSRPALSRVSLQVPEGKAFACVGPVGSGKTTLLRLLSGLYRPSAGECSVLGLSPFFEADRLHAVTGVVLDSAQLYKNMTVSENLRFFAGLNEVEENDSIDRLSFLLHRLDIWESREEKAGNVTTGVAHRAALARALMHRPRVLLVDAPADGFDLETADAIRELLRYLVEEEGVTVLFCTENMEYAAGLCEGFFFLHQGALIARGTVESLRLGAGVNCRALLRLGEGEQPPKGFRRKEGSWQREIKSKEELPKLIAQLIEEGKSIYEARVIRPGLEEIYNAFLAGGVHRAGGEYEEDDEDQNGADAANGGPEPRESAAAVSAEGDPQGRGGQAGEGTQQSADRGPGASRPQEWEKGEIQP